MVGAPLFLAQIGLDVAQQVMRDGDHKELELISLSDVGTMDELLEALARAHPFMVLKLLNMKKGNVI